ncbi:MAG: hypothetical protein WBI20_11740 [Burkholderiaceae bacterium]
MRFLDGLIHLLWFLSPALVMALLLPIPGRLWLPNNPKPRTYLAQVAVNFLVCALVLVSSLWGWGEDGKMASYGALVLAGASCQWLISGGWRR